MKKTISISRFARYRSTPGVLLALALSGAVLASGGVASASSKPSAKTPTTAIKKFDSCLKKHGVSAPTFGLGTPPKGSPGGTNPPGGFPGSSKVGNAKTRAAFQACSSFLPKGSQFGGTAGTTSTAFAAYRNCMTLHHVTLPKGPSGSAPLAGSTVTSNPNFKKANAACSALLPSTPTKTTPKS